MGTWGVWLYQDDFASDLRNTIALLCKVPAKGDQLLEHLRQMFGEPDPSDDNGSLFWLVTADQFERRGIGCKKVVRTALERDLES